MHPLSAYLVRCSKEIFFGIAKEDIYPEFMKLNHLNALRAFEASVRLGSFRAAASEMNVTAAAVGQQVKKLEEAVGLELLERTPNGFVPTILARQVASQLETGFHHIADALDLMAQGSDPARLSISIVPTIAEYWFAPRVPVFWQANPAIDLRLDSTSTILNPAQSHFDFALRYGPETPGPGKSIDLFPEYLIPVCTPDLAERIDPENETNPFGDVPFLHTAPSTSDPNWPDWPQWCTTMGYHGVDIDSGARFTYTTLALRSMYAGNGVHLAQLSILLPALREGRLVAPFDAGHCVRTGYPYRLVCFDSKRLSPIHKSFVDWIVAEAELTGAELDEYLNSRSEK